MTKSEKIITNLVHVYLLLFIFSMVNREFLPFGIDLRMIELPLGFLIICINLISSKLVIKIDKEDSIGNSLIFFYIITMLLTISWLWNGLKVNEQKLINEMILLSNVFICCIVVYFNKKTLNFEFINKTVIVSCVVLSVSMILVDRGVPFEKIMGASDAASIYNSSELISNKNLYGESFRSAGYASDPNYATMLLLIGVITTIKSKEIKKIIKIVLNIFFLLCIGLSFSRTIVLTSIVLGLYIWLIKKINISDSKIKILSKSLLVIVVLVEIIIPFIADFLNFLPMTLTTRFEMWKNAGKLFLQSPIIGNGLTSFRSYFAINHWYVQAHSTYWQILSELGIVGLVLYIRILFNSIDKSINNKYNYFLTLVFIIWIMTCETIALQFSIFILYILTLQEKKKNIANKVLFFINSISNGGAERVCINLSNEFVRQGYKVDFILLENIKNGSEVYEINDNMNIFTLNINETNKIKKIIKIILSIYKVNRIISEREEQDGEYCLITSHLPMSNIITRFSNVRNRAIYVFHTKIKSYDKMKIKPLFRLGLKWIFAGRKIVTVSNGVLNEAINDYNFKPNLVKKIYNPINEKEIKKLAQEKIDMDNKYFVQVGRFNEAKRQDRMLDIFYKGEFYKNYNLVFCGTGELENQIREKVDKLGIQENVIFLGWQSNVYKWIYNSEMLICTSDYEAFPMNLIEALACGTKVVSSNCNFGPNEILLGEYAEYLVNSDDIDEYIEKINEALKKYPNSNNPILEKCNSGNIIKEYLKFYAE